MIRINNSRAAGDTDSILIGSSIGTGSFEPLRINNSRAAGLYPSVFKVFMEYPENDSNYNCGCHFFFIFFLV